MKNDNRHPKPPIDAQKGFLTFILGTLLIGQVEILSTMGVFWGTSLTETYEVAFWFVPFYWLYPQIQYVLVEILLYLEDRGVVPNE